MVITGILREMQFGRRHVVQTMSRLFGECQGLGWVIVEAREWWLMTRCSSFSWSTFGVNAKEQELHILDMWSGDPPTMSSSEYRRLLCHSEKRASFFLTSLFLLLPFHTILRLSLFLWQWTHWLWLANLKNLFRSEFLVPGANQTTSYYVLAQPGRLIFLFTSWWAVWILSETLDPKYFFGVKVI